MPATRQASGRITPTGDAAERFDRRVSAADHDGAVAVVDRLLDDDLDPVAILIDVIASGQRQVGLRWERGEWSVAQEHAATAISVSATEAVMRRVNQVPVTAGHVLVACADREWHTLPAMIIGAALRAHGFDVTLLGASTPAARWSQYLHDLGPDATAVSCSVLSAVPSTRRFIEASTSAGVPIVVGGAAFGFDASRAVALGATAWAATARDAVTVVTALPAVVRAAAALPAGPAAEQVALQLDHARLVDTLGARWSLTACVATADPQSHDVLPAIGRDVIAHVLHAVSAALLTGDPRVVSEAASWVTRLLAARGVGPAAVAELGGLLATSVRDYPLAHALIAQHWARHLSTCPGG